MTRGNKPNLDQSVYPTRIVAALVEVLREAGFRPARILDGSDLDPARLDDPLVKLSYRQILAVWHNAVQIAGDSDLILQAGRRMHFAAYGVVGYTVISSPSHEAAADRAIRFGRLVGPLSRLRLEQEGGTAVWVYDPIFWEDPDDPLYRAAVEFHLASHLTMLSNLYGVDARVDQVRVAYERPGLVRRYEDFFGCPALVGQPRNEFRHGNAMMERPMAYSDPATHAAVRETCERRLAEMSGSVGVAADVRRLLLERDEGFPCIDEVARRLSMNVRTLRRRLEAENTSFRTIVAEVRKQLALTYLRTTTMKHEQIAAKLGYSDAANFRHAFLRWTGRNPSDFRER
ncbi:MAG: AraC family transcriptional regulator [Burkholderiaceae bacterium]